ncbi:hypothetical protein PCANC_00377 [Puccinia coronata f. sp. avenae]|uniref:Domain of unknown function at the cortex 1 domain-containing protein n=1 Tax=Puccinia coronata f. sp. avenae TaxID=200324 RepID=A0A2N5SQ75_9BASI|nr:hypothetical protein PCASD_19985 [Puccinia coronata f. sp. avenae]PLW58871.1 hypothetical protein PCANC_00377 [Puccinia coronata f. sp. avenae]
MALDPPCPKFQVLAGPSAEELSPVNVNADKTDPFRIHTDLFQGALTVRIKNFLGADGRLSPDTENNYFKEWSQMTCSIQIQGRFLQPTTADDCMWGNSFDRPIRDRLPYGTSVALKAMSYIDPSLEHDIYSDKPWAWSPLLATMNHVQTGELESDDAPLPDWEGTRPVEDCTSIVGNLATITSKRERRRFLSSAENRQALVLGPRDFINVEFVNGFVDYSTLRLQIPIVKLSFRLDKLWDGQPIRYECISRSTLKTYFVIVVQIIELHGRSVSGDVGEPGPAHKRT